MNSFCTIIDSNYIAFANVLYSSITEFDKEIKFNVLVTDAERANFPAVLNNNIQFYSVSELGDTAYARDIYNKYVATNSDHLRWALKPVFIGYLLENNFDKVIFLDPDIFFIGNYDFILNQLDYSSVLLTPHWNNINPLEFEDGLFSIMRNGMFNAGFIGAAKNGIPAMKWWAGMCHYKMDRQVELGIYDDQKYLDLLPVEFPGSGILRHQGCNLASWNIDTCKREIINGKLMINKIYEPVFIHFAKDTITNILNRNDELLKPYLDEYIQALQNENFDLLKNLDNLDHAKFNSSLYSIKHKLRLRTRLKRFLFRLAEKL